MQENVLKKKDFELKNVLKKKHVEQQKNIG